MRQKIQLFWQEYRVDVTGALLAALLSYLLFGVIFSLGVVLSGSMEPTYMTGSFFIGNRLVDTEHLERGSVVAFHFGDDDYFKRIIGLPGETIIFCDGQVFIDGIRYDESEYLSPTVETNASSARSVFVVPDNCYFMLGDNRDNSYDSRYWDDPYIPADDIFSKVMVSVEVPILGIICQQIDW